MLFAACINGQFAILGVLGGRSGLTLQDCPERIIVAGRILYHNRKNIIPSSFTVPESILTGSIDIYMKTCNNQKEWKVEGRHIYIFRKYKENPLLKVLSKYIK